MVLYKCKKERLKKIMRKLNQNQVEQIKKVYPKLVGLIVKYVEKIGNDKMELVDDVQLALDIIAEKQ